MKASERCYQAAQYMAEHGHVKFILMDDAGRVCLAGALGMTYQQTMGWPNTLVHILEDMNKRVRPLTGAEVLYGGRGGAELPCVIWNNLTSTSPEDVILFLKEQGAIYAEQGL